MTRSAQAPSPRPWCTLEDVLRESGLQSLDYLLEKCVFTEGVLLRNENLAALAARVGEARADFLSALHLAGVDVIADRQRLANCLARGVREGHITCGWARPPPDSCAHCAMLPAAGKKLLTCGRCKTVKYCSANCQRAAWGAHKAACKAPAATQADEWKAVAADNAVTNAGPQAWKSDVGVGGWGGHPVLGNGVVVDRRE